MGPVASEGLYQSVRSRLESAAAREEAGRSRPHRPVHADAADVAEAAQKIADSNGLGRLRNQTAIDMLQSGDVAVVDLFGKIEGGTFVGDKLADYVQKTTGTGLVVDGALYYLSRIQKTGMPAYYCGTHPGALTDVMLSGVNVPVRIGNAIVMPGDIVLGDRDLVLFIRFTLSKRSSSRPARSGRAWVKGKFDTGKYKSGEIYGRPTDPQLQKELEEFMKQRTTKKPN